MTENISADFSNIVYENPEVVALIQDLGLVQKDTPEYRSFIAARARSRYSRYFFCERYKDFLKSMAERRSIVVRNMYLAYRKGSRFMPSPDVVVSGLLKLF